MKKILAALTYKQKILFFSCVFVVLLVRLLYIASFPLNFGGDGSMYYAMIHHKQSAVMTSGGYPFLMMWPFYIMRKITSFFLPIREDSSLVPFWQTTENQMTSVMPIEGLDNTFSWVSFLQNHDFILFQHSIELLALFCGFLIVRKYFGFYVSLIFVVLYGLSPLSLEDSSSVRPEWLQGAFFIFWVYSADKAKEAVVYSKKLLLYVCVGVLAALGFLVKVNGLPVFMALFACLLYIDREQFSKMISKAGVAIAAGGATVLLFIATYHFPTTQLSSLPENSWVLADKAFAYSPEPFISPSLGIKSKRFLAIQKALPSNNPKIIYNAALYSQSITAKHQAIREPFREKLLWLMTADETALDQQLATYGYNRILDQLPCIHIAYYIGFLEYNTLLRGVYFDMMKKYPNAFIQDTLKKSLVSFASKERSLGYRPTWDEVENGRNHLSKSNLGYVTFAWNEERDVLYHENVVWLPGLWLFTKHVKYWPPLWVVWILSAIACFVALKNIKMGFKSLQDYYVIVSMTIILLFILFSNVIYLFRLKEFRAIQAFVTVLAAIGLYQMAFLIKDYFRTLAFRFKVLKQQPTKVKS